MIANPGSFQVYKDSRPWLDEKTALKRWEQELFDYQRQQKLLAKQEELQNSDNEPQ